VNESTVMEDGFGALRRRAGAHGLSAFDLAEAAMAIDDKDAADLSVAPE
jgi:hypothetical protein